MAEKTEKATPKKLRDARKKGQVAKSQDFPSAFTFVVSIIATIFTASYIYKNTTGFILSMFYAARENLENPAKIVGYMGIAMQLILMTSTPIVIVVAFIGVLTNFLIIGPVFSFEPMKFNLKKLNPVEGIKQKFKLKTLVELLKSIAKIVGAAIIIYYVILETIPAAIATVAMPVEGAAYVLGDFLRKVTIRVGVFFLVVALFDLFFQRRVFQKEMMMEKFEVKQEYKDTEGDPIIKGKRREKYREIAYQEGPKAASRAKAIITNPTHIAVAIGYGPKDPVPLILTMGAGLAAEKIIQIGVENKVPIMRNPTLARTLYHKGGIDEYIPSDTYEAIAEVLKWIKSLETTSDANLELFR